MARRIFRNIVLAAVFGVLLTALLIVPALYRVHEAALSRALYQEAEDIVRALELIDEADAYLNRLSTDNRITLIDSDGAVLYESQADAAQMPNHAARPEVAEALKNGLGESTRASDTLSETTIYYALRTEDGRVLRLASTRRSMLGTFLNVAPQLGLMLLMVVLISLLLARQSARRIVSPINTLNLDKPLENNTYDELAPLLTRMHRQHEEITRQMTALESARTELAVLMQNMREGMILLDTKNAVLSINESAAHLFNLDASHLTGHNLLAVIRDADLAELTQRALSGTPGSLPLTRHDRHYELCVSPVVKNETVCGTVLLIIDVTARFEAEQSRREFTANVSHELKTPLTSISGFAEIIRDGIAQPQDVRSFAGMICREASRLITLVNDILELSRLDEGTALGSFENLSLMALLKPLTEDFAPAAQKKNLTLRLEGEDALVSGQALLLHEMFFNLIDNAVKYTPEGGQITVAVQKDGARVRCSVSDTGIGIPEEHILHVFERFYRVDKSHSRQTGGTGLGLAIVKHVAQIHKATLAMHSVMDLGTRVEITFEARSV